MINKNLLAENNIPKKYLKESLNKKFNKAFFEIQRKILESSSNSLNIYNTLSKNFKFNFKKNDLKKFKRFNSIAIIGMGGSILGSEAIYQFFKKKIKKEIFFFNDLDNEKIKNFRKKVKLSRTLFLIVSKSGNTIETLSNLFILKILKKNAKNVIIISQKKNSILFNLSKKFNLFFIEHKSHIGGRYSVLSEVGMVPAYLMGLNIFKLRKNLKKYLINKEKFFLKESSIKLANILYQKKFSNMILLNYSPRLEKFLFWCQQLIAESLGKSGKGFLPIISSAPKDHHSLLQLYLDGPKDKIFHIFSYPEDSYEIKTKKFTNKINFIHNKNLNSVKLAQKDAFILSLKKKEIPFREFKIKKIDEEAIGELFSYYILEISIIGKLLGLNPFNQPAVEQVKISTKFLLT